MFFSLSAERAPDGVYALRSVFLLIFLLMFMSARDAAHAQRRWRCHDRCRETATSTVFVADAHHAARCFCCHHFDFLHLPEPRVIHPIPRRQRRCRTCSRRSAAEHAAITISSSATRKMRRNAFIFADHAQAPPALSFFPRRRLFAPLTIIFLMSMLKRAIHRLFFHTRAAAGFIIDARCRYEGEALLFDSCHYCVLRSRLPMPPLPDKLRQLMLSHECHLSVATADYFSPCHAGLRCPRPLLMRCRHADTRGLLMLVFHYFSFSIHAIAACVAE